jgi:hypothetical protein
VIFSTHRFVDRGSTTFKMLPVRTMFDQHSLLRLLDHELIRFRTFPSPSRPTISTLRRSEHCPALGLLLQTMCLSQVIPHRCCGDLFAQWLEPCTPLPGSSNPYGSCTLILAYKYSRCDRDERCWCQSMKEICDDIEQKEETSAGKMMSTPNTSQGAKGREATAARR